MRRHCGKTTGSPGKDRQMKHPTREVCEELLNEYQTPEHVKGHCRAVARTAYTIAEALNKNGFLFDLQLILAAGMLHDIARVEDKHWKVGAKWVKRLGYKEEARIIKAHMKHSFPASLKKIDETDMVCLGDRLVMEDQYVGLDRRIEYIISKAEKKGHPEAKPIILKNKEKTRLFMDKIEAVIGCTIEELMRGNE